MVPPLTYAVICFSHHLGECTNLCCLPSWLQHLIFGQRNREGNFIYAGFSAPSCGATASFSASAARWLADRAFGKPPQAVEISDVEREQQAASLRPLADLPDDLKAGAGRMAERGEVARVGIAWAM